MAVEGWLAGCDSLSARPIVDHYQNYVRSMQSFVSVMLFVVVVIITRAYECMVIYLLPEPLVCMLALLGPFASTYGCVYNPPPTVY